MSVIVCYLSRLCFAVLFFLLLLWSFTSTCLLILYAQTSTSRYFVVNHNFIRVLFVCSFKTLSILVFNVLHIFFTNSQGQHLDVICFNRYNGWYRHTGALYDIVQKVVDEATQFHGHNKPVIMTEYGADTIPGLHLVSVIL